MHVGVEDGEDEFGGYAGGVGRGVEFGEETLVPGVYGVLEEFGKELEEAYLAESFLRELEIE